MLLTANSSRQRKSTCVKLASKTLREIESRRLGPDDFSAEALAKHMKKYRRILLPIEEFGDYLATASRSYGQKLNTTLCKLYDGGSFNQIRTTRGPIRVKDPCLGLIGGVAFGMLEKYANRSDWDTGFFARMIFVTPDTPRASLEVEPVQSTTKWDIVVSNGTALRAELEARERAYDITKEAIAIYGAWVHQQPDEKSMPDPSLVAQRERLNNAAWKIAMLYQTDIDPQAEIGVIAVERAIQFVNRAWSGFQFVYGQSAGTPTGRLVKRVWRRLTEIKEMSRRDMLRVTHSALDELYPVVQLLQTTGVIGLKNVGGVPTYYIIDPMVDF